MIGMKFNKWLVISEAEHPTRDDGRCFLCECVCGNRSIIRKRALIGKRQSSGCRACGRIGHGEKIARHGMTRTPSWNSWHAMMSRVNPWSKDKKRRSYVERRILVVPPMDIFEEFYKHMGDRPVGKTLDRINNDLGYQLGNLQWSTRKEQAINRSTTRLVTFNGETLSNRDWAKRLNITEQAMSTRLKNWTVERALTTPNLKNLTYNNLID